MSSVIFVDLLIGLIKKKEFWIGVCAIIIIAIVTFLYNDNRTKKKQLIKLNKEYALLESTYETSVRVVSNNTIIDDVFEQSIIIHTNNRGGKLDDTEIKAISNVIDIYNNLMLVD